MTYKCKVCSTESEEKKECCGSDMEEKYDCSNVKSECSCGE